MPMSTLKEKLPAIGQSPRHHVDIKNLNNKLFFILEENMKHKIMFYR